MPIDELGKGAFRMMEPRYELQASMQVSTATIGHSNTDRVSGDTNKKHLAYLPSPAKGKMREKQHTASMNGTQDKLQRWQAKHISSAKPHIRPHRAWSP